MSNFPYIQAILVPQGAEYKAVCKGLSRVTGYKPAVVPIPVGTKSVIRCLQSWRHDLQLNQLPSQVLVMGLCGSLNPRYGIGATVLYQDCVYPLEKTEAKIQSCDRPLTDLLYSSLQYKGYLVKAMTSDCLIHKASEKRYLAQTYGADVVDMEGFAALQVLSRAGVAVAMLRVVSDNCHHDIADLSAALSPEGALLPLPLALGTIRQPIAAARLIQGALRGLYVLQKVTHTLFSSYAAD